MAAALYLLILAVLATALYGQFRGTLGLALTELAS